MLLFPALAAAQGSASQNPEPAWTARPKLEIIASAAAVHVFRFDDRSFGDYFNFGAGVEVPVWGKLRIGAEINKTFGLSPTPVKCGAILDDQGQPLPCVGTARQGLESAIAGSITALYFFGEGRIQPYIFGGVGIMSAKECDVSSIVHQDYVELHERQMGSTGIGPALGVGLRASINRHLSIRPEVRLSDGTALSSLNMSQWRLSLGVAYGW